MPGISRTVPSLICFVVFLYGSIAEGQSKIRPSEIETYLKPSIDEYARKHGMDRETAERVSSNVAKRFSGEKVVDARDIDAEFRLQLNRIEMTPAPQGLDTSRQPEIVPQLGTQSVQDLLKDPSARVAPEIALLRVPPPRVTSEMRRRAVAAELGSDGAKVLTHDALGDYLRDTLKVHDYQQVRDSFDPKGKAEVVTLPRKMTLLRLFGGDAKPVGRYHFCCLWSAKDGSPHQQWSDASGLATPPENLLEHLAVVTLPAGTKVVVGTVADNFANEAGLKKSGGNTQIFVSEVKTPLFREYRLAHGDAAPSDFIVHTDDRILRFRPVADK